MHAHGAAPRVRVAHRSIRATTHEERSIATHCASARLIEERRSVITRDCPAAGAIWRVLRQHDLALPRLDRGKLREEQTRERIRRYDDATGRYRAARRAHVMP